MRLTRIAARNFMRFERLDLDLSTATSVVVVGKNGHGKSILFDVVRFAIYGKGRFAGPRAGGSPDQQIRHDTDELWACVEFDTPDGSHVRVERSKARGKTGSVGLWVDGEDRTETKGRKHTNAETDALIESFVGLSYEMITAGPWMAQEEASALMKADAAARLRMFVSLFEAEWCAPLHDDAKKLRDKHDADRAAAAARVAEALAIIEQETAVTSQLGTLRNALAGLTERQSLASEQETTLKVRMAEAQTRVSRHATLEAEEAALAANLQRNGDRAAQLTAVVDRADAFLAKPAPIMPTISYGNPARITEIDELLIGARAAETRAVRLQAEVEHASADHTRLVAARGIVASVPCGAEGIYASCQFLTGVPTEETVAILKAQIDETHAAAAAANEEAKAVPRLEAEQRDLRQAQREGEQAHTTATAGIAQYDQSKAAAETAKQEHGATIGILRDQIAADNSALERVKAERVAIQHDFKAIVDIEAEAEQLRTTLADVRKRIADVEPVVRQLEGSVAVIEKAKTDLTTWTAREDEARGLAELYATLAKAFHVTGIPTLIVENGLALVEERANEVLERLPEDFHIELRTQRAKKDGGTMDALDVVITTMGYETDYAMLSVGQRFRVDIALRLGLASVLMLRRGTTISTLWLDEPLADLDDEGREAVVETLSALGADFDLTVVVSHHADFNDRFDSIVAIAMDDEGVSTATVDGLAGTALVPA